MALYKERSEARCVAGIAALSIYPCGVQVSSRGTVDQVPEKREGESISAFLVCVNV